MSEEIHKLFSDIHENYDSMNHILSLGVDKAWRKRIAEEAVIDKKRYRILDVAAGTGDLTIAMKRMCDSNGKEVNILGVDFNEDMLGVAKIKAKKLGMNVRFQTGDALSLKFPKDSFDIVTSSFALRDFDDLNKFIKEANRVLNDNGKIILADMAKPDSGPMKYLFKIYFNVMILEGMFVDKNAYSFLVNSIKKFDKKNLERLLKKNGFTDIKIEDLPSKVAFMATARKKA